MPWQQTTAATHYTSGRLEWAGGGDADVFTKGGRTTRVTLIADNIRPADDWRSVLVDIFYSVLEMRSNNTFLRWRGTAELPVPTNAQRRRMRLMNVRNYNMIWDVRGEVHDMDEVPQIAGTAIAPGSLYRIDGPGDDQTNAEIDLQLRVPVEFDDAT
jgi:hypothetical protein